MFVLFAFVNRLLNQEDGLTLILVAAAAILAAGVELRDLAAPSLDESCADQASTDLGAATLAMASSFKGREWPR